MKGESTIQTEIVAFLSSISGKYRFSFFSVPNEAQAIEGGPRSKRRMAIAQTLRNMGLQPGANDLVICHDGRFYGLEVKSATGRQSKKQKDFERWILRTKGKYEIARSVEECEKVLINWGIIKHEK